MRCRAKSKHDVIDVTVCYTYRHRSLYFQNAMTKNPLLVSALTFLNDYTCVAKLPR